MVYQDELRAILDNLNNGKQTSPFEPMSLETTEQPLPPEPMGAQDLIKSEPTGLPQAIENLSAELPQARQPSSEPSVPASLTIPSSQVKEQQSLPSQETSATSSSLEAPKDPEMEAAIQKKNEMNRMAMLLSGINRMSTAFATQGAKSAKELGTDDFSDLQKMGESGISDITEKRKAQDYAIKRQQELRDLLDDKQKADPNSNKSQFYRSLVSKSMPSIPKESLDKMSASDIEKTFPFIAKIAEREEKAEQKGLDRQQKDLDRQLRKEQLDANIDMLKERMKETQMSREERIRHNQELEGLTKERNTLQSDTLKERIDQKNKGNLSRVQEAFNKDPQIQDLQKRKQRALDAEALLDIKGPITDEAVKASLARLSGEVGVLTDQDVARFGGSKALVSKLAQSTKQMASGTLTDENRHFMKQMTQTFKDRIEKSIKQRAVERSKQASKTYGMPVGEAYDFLRPGEAPPKVTMKTPGGQLIAVPFDKVDEAKKRGATEQ